ncbi:hypothetical protein PLEOSDRAFT_157655 [Pleurotus ostreatus PC15]|uniref:Uncharacterized protein n=1 Tax=Pleurotus ostreatus (strain PC15) TaxID=1137138 RepID=A0A067NXY8_PLEO1|nr:hypothetical protein PLEOSDRAFT_157655 [Pleurotus ostreatus PC15]
MQEDAAREAELFQVQPQQSAPMESTPSHPSRSSNAQQGDRTPATGHGRTPSTTRNNDEVPTASAEPDTVAT